MSRPIRKWKAFCPNCDYPHIFPEFSEDKVCFAHTCIRCGTEYVSPSYRFHCNDCSKLDHCIECPSAESLIYSSTWRGLIHARMLGFKKIASRDLQCLFYLHEEDRIIQADVDLPILSQLHQKPATVTLKTDTRTFVFGVSQPKSKPDFCPVIPRLGIMGRKKDD